MNKNKIRCIFICLLSCILLSGCAKIGNVLLTWKITEKYAAASPKNVLTAEESNLLFMELMNRYNSYYRQTGDNDFWQEQIDGDSFSSYLRDHQLKEEIAMLLVLDDLADQKGIRLTDEEKTACLLAAESYYASLTAAEKDFCRAEEEDVVSLYEKYRKAENVMTALSGNEIPEISDNDKRVITIQLICTDDWNAAETAQKEAAGGADFLALAKEVSRLDQTEYQVSRGELNPALETVAFYLEDDEISDVISIEGDYYIIRCVDEYDEVLSESNEEAVYRKYLHDLWYPQAEAYAENVSVDFNQSYWKALNFEMSDMTNTKLFEYYNEAFESNNLTS